MVSYGGTCNLFSEIFKYDEVIEYVSSFLRGGAGGLESSCAVKASMVSWKKIKGLLYGVLYFF